MLCRIRFLTPILLLAAFAGCYTQLRAPGTSARQPPPSSSIQEESAPISPRVGPTFHTPFPIYRHYDPWDCLFYDPYHSWRSTRIRVRFSYGPFWSYPWFHRGRIVLCDPWEVWYPTALFCPTPSYGGFFLPQPTHSTPVPTSTVARRPRIRRIGFDSAIPSAAAIRGGT